MITLFSIFVKSYYYPKLTIHQKINRKSNLGRQLITKNCPTLFAGIHILENPILKNFNTFPSSL